jgi:hypothetical protein
MLSSKHETLPLLREVVKAWLGWIQGSRTFAKLQPMDPVPCGRPQRIETIGSKARGYPQGLDPMDFVPCGRPQGLEPMDPELADVRMVWIRWFLSYADVRRVWIRWFLTSADVRKV